MKEREFFLSLSPFFSHQLFQNKKKPTNQTRRYSYLHPGTTLLANALSMAAADGGVGVAYLHAHVANEEALAFYREKLGFRRGATARGYYRRLTPPDAVVLWRRLR